MISFHNKRCNRSHPYQPKSNFTNTNINTIKLLPLEICYHRSKSIVITSINTQEIELWQLGWEQLLQKAHHNMLIISGIVQNTVKFQNANFYHFLAKIVQSLLRFTNGYTYNVLKFQIGKKHVLSSIKR